MTLQTFQELEILKYVADIKTETGNLWEIVHAVRRLETKVNEIAAAMVQAAPAPTPPVASPEPAPIPPTPTADV
jgi:hypothetical protein